jgi:hypothetical protein
MVAEGVRRGGEHNNQPKEGRAGRKGTAAQRTATAVRAMAVATAEVRVMAAEYAAVRAEATAKRVVIVLVLVFFVRARAEVCNDSRQGRSGVLPWRPTRYRQQ